jgi:hypothetical protein
MYRVPDKRYRRGWRYTPEGLHRRRVRRLWAGAVVVGLALLIASPHVAGPIVVVAIGAAVVWKIIRVKRPEQAPASWQTPYEVPAYGVPQDRPLGETRQREPIANEVKAAVWQRDGGRCRHCGISDHDAVASTGQHLAYDHIVPFSQNGANTVGNLQLLCTSCNSRKGNRFVG